MWPESYTSDHVSLMNKDNARSNNKNHIRFAFDEISRRKPLYLRSQSALNYDTRKWRKQLCQRLVSSCVRATCASNSRLKRSVAERWLSCYVDWEAAVLRTVMVQRLLTRWLQSTNFVSASMWNMSSAVPEMSAQCCTSRIFAFA